MILYHGSDLEIKEPNIIYSRKNLDFGCGFYTTPLYTLDDALNFFYHSDVYQLMKDGVSDIHCMSDAYLIEDLIEEYERCR